MIGNQLNKDQIWGCWVESARKTIERNNFSVVPVPRSDLNLVENFEGCLGEPWGTTVSHFYDFLIFSM